MNQGDHYHRPKEAKETDNTSNSCQECSQCFFHPEGNESDFITIAERVGSKKLEFPKECNGTVLLKTLHRRFPEAIGLKYKGPEGKWISICIEDTALIPPVGGWGDTVYCLLFSDKRKAPEMTGDGEPESKVRKPLSARAMNPYRRALAITGLSKQTTSWQLKKHLETKYGKVSLCKINTFMGTNQSKGFGFIRFTDECAAKAAINCQDDVIDGSRIKIALKKDNPMKFIVKGIPQSTSEEELTNYFSEFGQVTDVHIPSAVKQGTANFGFITMESSNIGRKILKQTHHFNNKYIRVQLREENKSSKASMGAVDGYQTGQETSVYHSDQSLMGSSNGGYYWRGGHSGGRPFFNS